MTVSITKTTVHAPSRRLAATWSMNGPFDTFEVPDQALREQAVSMTALYHIYYLSNFGHHVRFKGSELTYNDARDWCLIHTNEHFTSHYRTPLSPASFLTELEYRAEHNNRTRITMADLVYYNVEKEIEETLSQNVVFTATDPQDIEVVRHFFFQEINDAMLFKLTWVGV